MIHRLSVTNRLIVLLTSNPIKYIRINYPSSIFLRGIRLIHAELPRARMSRAGSESHFP
jgi:hypothetical protein